MLHIVSRPPFDDFSFNLFRQLFLTRGKYGLKDSNFIYTWTGYMSLDDGICSLEHPGSLITHNTIRLFFWKYGYQLAVGEHRYAHTLDELYELFMNDFSHEPDVNENTKTQFIEACNLLHRKLLDRKQAEQKIQDIIEQKDTIVLFVKDHFRVKTDNSWLSMDTEIGTYYKNLFEFYPNKRFILVTSLENLDKEITSPNVTIIPMGGDITNQSQTFKDYKFVQDKVYYDPINFCCFNRGLRNHRTYLVSLLYGLELNKQGKISYLGIDSNTRIDDVFKNYDLESDEYGKIIKRGFNDFKEIATQDDYDIYGNSPNNNLTNFNDSLSIKYKNTFVELVTDTSYNEYGFNLTEKFLHSVNGCNIPIIVSSPGYVNFLREIGLDVFDDIVNHSYDNEIDKVKRITSMLENNMELLLTDKAFRIFESNKNRFLYNRNFVENELLTFYNNRFWNRIQSL